MSLRTRVTLAGGCAVFVALAIASVVIYFAVRSKLHDQVDASLIKIEQNVATKVGYSGAQEADKVTPRKRAKGTSGRPYLGTDASGYFQVIPSVGAIARGRNELSARATAKMAKVGSKGLAVTTNAFVPLGPRDRLIATGLEPPYFRDVDFHGTTLRLYTARLGASGDGLVRAARPLTETNATLQRVRWLLLGLTLGGALLAALLGRLAAAAVLRPVRSLADAVQDVATTRDVTRRISVSSRDEVGSLAANFNAMLGALDESQQTQQQLIADASHELRTPLTAHRTNIELLARPDLPPERRRRVLAAAVRGLDELSKLVNDLIQAARNGTAVDARTPVALDSLVARAVARAEAHTGGVRFVTRLEPYTVSGAATRIERAVDNVLDNAVKWSPDGGTVEVTLVDGLLTVRDHGVGIEESDLPHVFDRFYRGVAARNLPGSGLGLAIVKQTVDDHGGSVSAANAEGGGTAVSLRFDAPALTKL